MLVSKDRIVLPKSEYALLLNIASRAAKFSPWNSTDDSGLVRVCGCCSVELDYERMMEGLDKDFDELPDWLVVDEDGDVDIAASMDAFMEDPANHGEECVYRLATEFFKTTGTLKPEMSGSTEDILALRPDDIEQRLEDVREENNE